MTSLEEAREQAREALAQWDAPGGNHSGQVIGFLASALRALLDATEPPAPLSIEDFITGTTDGEVDTDEFFADLDERPAEDEREALVNVIRLFFQNWRAIGRVSPSLEMSIDSLEGAVDDLIELDAPNDGDYHEGFEEGVKVGRAEQGDRRPCRLPHTAPPCTTCRCGARETCDAATKHAALAEQGETEWEYIAQFGHVRGEERITAEAAIQSAREVLDDYPLDFPESELPMQVLRRPLVGWLPVPDTTNKGSEGKA